LTTGDWSKEDDDKSVPLIDIFGEKMDENIRTSSWKKCSFNQQAI
jgi:hypothetical protein